MNEGAMTILRYCFVVPGGTEVNYKPLSLYIIREKHSSINKVFNDAVSCELYIYHP
jgi:hypothetical protein